MNVLNLVLFSDIIVPESKREFRASQAKSLFTWEMGGLPEYFVNKQDATPYYNGKTATIPINSEGCIRPTSDVEGLIVDFSAIV